MRSYAFFVTEQKDFFKVRQFSRVDGKYDLVDDLTLQQVGQARNRMHVVLRSQRQSVTAVTAVVRRGPKKPDQTDAKLRRAFEQIADPNRVIARANNHHIVRSAELPSNQADQTARLPPEQAQQK